MKFSNSLWLFSFMSLILCSCDNNYRNVEITGLVSDSISDVPISDARVTIKCWVYDTEIWESRIVEKETITNSKGEFEVTFEKGEAFDLLVQMDGYRDYDQSVTLVRNTFFLSIKLEKE
ncbi:MAG: hypothetical protein ACRBG0_17975 [Lewinella sp.]|uniref:hypothetical protein n=1 Tax=Lewinella sp. TaxID=2004506 RepID=UPI003D6BB60A